MSDPCEPPIPDPHPHHHAHIVGRIRRHGTARVARRLHDVRSGCLPGPKTAFSAVLVRGAATVAGLGVLNATQAASASSDPSVNFNSQTGQGGASSQGHRTTDIPEPSSLAVLLIAALAWTGMRKFSRRARRRQVSPS
jgi:hypothetical protein